MQTNRFSLRPLWAFALVAIVVSVFLIGRARRSIANDEAVAAETTRVGRDRGGELRTSKEQPRSEAGARTSNREASIDSAAVRDGEGILTVPIPDFWMVFRAMTNSGVPSDRAKSLLRPAISHLSYLAACDRFIFSRDQYLADDLERVRQDDSQPVRDREDLMKLFALNHRQFRETWTARKEKRMEEFSGFVSRLGVANPDELIKDLLLIQPQSPAPDPKPE